MIYSIMPVLMDWSMDSFLDSVKEKLEGWVGVVIAIIGIVMIAAGVYQIAKGLAGHGKAQVSWPVAILLVVIGGLFVGLAGISLFKDIGEGAKTTIDDLGNGVFLPFL